MLGNKAASASSTKEMLRPPIDHGMRVLNRDFFTKTVNLAAARVLENKLISPCRTSLRHDQIQLTRLGTVLPDPLDASSGRKAILLRPEIKAEDSATWSDVLQKLVSEKKVSVVPFALRLTYENWDYGESAFTIVYCAGALLVPSDMPKATSIKILPNQLLTSLGDIMSSVLPQDDQDELPSGFSVVGHVAHLNLRSQYLQYKHLIANVLMDKNPAIRTVINKIDDVGSQNEYRTFQYELLAGDPSLETEVRELDCTFRFDYSKVYWNSRLNTEHERLVSKFRRGEAVCDVMAGVGPFAVPAGKRQIFTWANDLNPDSYKGMLDAISLNKVSNFVRPFNGDGREFIRQSAKMLREEEVEVDVTPKVKRSRLDKPSPSVEPRKEFLVQPKVFDHYVMNLPASAISFLDAFVGLFHGRETEFSPSTGRRLPMVHVHCFSTKSDDNKKEMSEICQEISNIIGHRITPADEDVEIWNVRDVAPKKRMFCASFRLPPEVAFR